MPKGPIRRGQLIAPFGTGALTVVRDGTSLITAGLDHWFESERGDAQIDINDFIVEEWRLSRLLSVDHFKLPPDFRKSFQGGDNTNCFLTIPFLRFPQWHFCPGCHVLVRLPLVLRIKPECHECRRKNKRRFLVQVPFIAMCLAGHVQDFPWREWVHQTVQPTCKKNMRLIATGGATLAAQSVRCDCGAKRSLANITGGDERTYLSTNLSKDHEVFPCQGHRPWLGTESGEPCDNHLKGTLRSASNLYFANLASALYLPRNTDTIPSELIQILEEPPLSTLIKMLRQAGGDLNAQMLRTQQSRLLQPYSDDQIGGALQCIIDDRDPDAGSMREIEPGAHPSTLRLAEYEALGHPRDDEQLVIEVPEIHEYQQLSQWFNKIALIKKLRETRVLTGFSRIRPSQFDLAYHKRQLWRGDPQNWLPATVVFGEGIFIEFNLDYLKRWLEEYADVVTNRADIVQRNYQQTGRGDRSITPQFILIHTFSHMLMNQLTFECGYSSASLRERLYVSFEEDQPEMAGVLIYTAAGDAEGTMGGLVGMGRAGRLEPTIFKALDAAKWCSADPVCMELGERGQGPQSLNLAACHGCALVPETACEEFNSLLDRAMVIGNPIEGQPFGYFYDQTLEAVT